MKRFLQMAGLAWVGIGALWVISNALSDVPRVESLLMNVMAVGCFNISAMFCIASLSFLRMSRESLGSP